MAEHVSEALHDAHRAIDRHVLEVAVDQREEARQVRCVPVPIDVGLSEADLASEEEFAEEVLPVDAEIGSPRGIRAILRVRPVGPGHIELPGVPVAQEAIYLTSSEAIDPVGSAHFETLVVKSDP